MSRTVESVRMIRLNSIIGQGHPPTLPALDSILLATENCANMKLALCALMTFSHCLQNTRTRGRINAIQRKAFKQFE